jgi:hypothetical protein
VNCVQSIDGDSILGLCSVAVTNGLFSLVVLNYVCRYITNIKFIQAFLIC